MTASHIASDVRRIMSALLFPSGHDGHAGDKATLNIEDSTCVDQDRAKIRRRNGGMKTGGACGGQMVGRGKTREGQTRATPRVFSANAVVSSRLVEKPSMRTLHCYSAIRHVCHNSGRNLCSANDCEPEETGAT